MQNQNPTNTQTVNVIPRVSRECIEAQWEAITRNAPHVAVKDMIRILKVENPELLKFLTASVAGILGTEELSDPDEGLLRMVFLGHLGVMYRMIRAQMQANMYNDAWPIELSDEKDTTEEPDVPF
jgi:hypothetical protein